MTANFLHNPPLSWQQQLNNGFQNPQDLCHYLSLDPDLLNLEYTPDFPFKVPLAYVKKIRPGNPMDPLLLQILPLQQENQSVPGFLADPVGDLQAMPTPGLLHKYNRRALIITTGGCAIHCRYCFRRNFPYAEGQIRQQNLQQALLFLEQNPQINEVILSGGDPLLLSDDKLGHLCGQIKQLKHIKTLRIHSRIPLVLPDRITESLADLISSTTQHSVVVLHSNHRNELDKAVQKVCRLMQSYGITLLNQSVLLKNINDNATDLIDLSETLFECGVLPYYLHLLDQANGTAHFQVSENHALELMAKIRLQLPGYLVPRLVKEQPGAGSKTVII